MVRYAIGMSEPEKRQTREEIAAKLAEYEARQQAFAGVSQRQLAEQLEIPRSTLQYWLARRDTIEADPAVVAFFESPAGVAFLHRLVLAAQFVITLLGAGGIRLVCAFLELSGLDGFVAASYGSQQQVSVALETAAVEFGQAEQARLAAGLRPKQVTVCQDETFHPEVCLVAIEPVSNYLLLEKYAPDRKAETWTAEMQAALGDMPIEIIQSTSDEGKGLCRHVQHDLGAHHSPDLFHVQQEVVRATQVALAGKTRQAEQALTTTTQAASRAQAAQTAYVNDQVGLERPPDLAQRLRAAADQARAAQAALETAQAHQARAQQAVQAISAAYHPYDLETGAPRTAETVSTALAQHFAELEAVIREADLPARCGEKLQKAKKVVAGLVATLAFFWFNVTAKVEALALPPQVERAVYDQLLPALYLRQVADKCDRADQRHRLRQKSQELLAPLQARAGPFRDLTAEERRVIEQVARECAGLFQRSSSCVEGRNGQLALRHHSLHRLSDRKLSALTTVHNYFIQRADGTTPAERFFEAKPNDLFEWLLEQVDLPARPAQSRSQPAP